jgi:hypothetical protein
MVVDTSNWWGGHPVLVAPQSIQAVSWPDAKVSLDLTRQAVKVAPPYDSAAQLDRLSMARAFDSQAVREEAQAAK